MLDPTRGPLSSPTRNSESWHCPSPDPSSSYQAGARVPEAGDVVFLPRAQPQVSANCLLLRPHREGPGGIWLSRATHSAFSRARQRFCVGGWTRQGLSLQLPRGQERLCAHGEPGPPLPLAPISLLISPLALVREPQGIQGRELAFLPKLVHPTLYLINGSWGRLPKGSPDGHGCWAVWSKGRNLPAWPGG